MSPVIIRSNQLDCAPPFCEFLSVTSASACRKFLSSHLPMNREGIKDSYNGGLNDLFSKNVPSLDGFICLNLHQNCGLWYTVF